MPTRHALLRCLLVVAALLLAIGCAGTEGLRLRALHHSARKPSNVAVFFTVDTADGKPVPSLGADAFTIYEDGERLSPGEAEQTVLNPTIAASAYTLLLIDMSGSIVASKKVGDIVNAASKFTERVGKFQKVAVAAFDGSADLFGVVPFTANAKQAQDGLDKLLSFRPRDPSTNLNGAVIEGLRILRRALDDDDKPVKLGTLVVFTDGTDRAGRVSDDKLRKALAEPAYKDFEVYAIGFGDDAATAHLEEVGRTATIKETDTTKLQHVFEHIAAKIEGATQRYYLLSYCTPRRKGTHEVTIEARSHGKRGKLSYKFTADGFGAGCDPYLPPDFDVEHPVDPPPAPASSAKKKGG